MKNFYCFPCVSLVLLAVLLSACSAGAADSAAIATTHAAQTVQAGQVMQTAVAQMKQGLTQTAQHAPTITRTSTKVVPTFGLPQPGQTQPPASPTQPDAASQPPPAAGNIPTPQPPPTLQPPPSASAVPAVPPQPASSSGEDKAEYANDTVKDGTEVRPGESFTQTWTLQNFGTTTWNTDYKVVFVNGDQLGAPSSVNLTTTISPEMVVNVSVPMVAPNKPGKYRGEWSIANDKGEKFGLGTLHTNFWIEIVVASPSAAPTKTKSPATE